MNEMPMFDVTTEGADIVLRIHCENEHLAQRVGGQFQRMTGLLSMVMELDGLGDTAP